MKVTHTNPKAEFIELYGELIQNLSKIPITSTVIRELYPEHYERIQGLIKVLDGAFNEGNRSLFIETVKEIKELVLACYFDEAGIVKAKPKPIELELKRRCINCGGNNWLVFKLKSRALSIKCLNCGHVEGYVKAKGEILEEYGGIATVKSNIGG